MAKKNSAPAKVYGIDDFIAEMKHPMPYIDTLSRIRLLTGFHKSALMMLRGYLECIMYDDPEDDSTNESKRLYSHWNFLLVAIECLIEGKDIPEYYIDTLTPSWEHGFDPLDLPYTKYKSSLRAQALVRFYTRKRVFKKEGKLYEHYNNVLKARYRQGKAIAKQDRSRYIQDHEMCGKILKSMNDRKVFSLWQDDRNLLKKNPDFRDYYDSE